MGGCRCSYKTCKSATKTHQELHFFHYPVKTRDRCLQWILNADRMEFSYLPNDQLRNKVICGLHFQESCFTNELRKRLVHDAVPTIDVGCDPEEQAPEKVEVFSDVDFTDRSYTNMEEESDEERSCDQTIMSERRVATITATSGDGSTFSLDTLSYDIPPKPHIVTYNFVNGSLVPTVSFHENTSESNHNGNTVPENEETQAFEDYTSIFGADPSVQYITDEAPTSPIRPIQSNSNEIVSSSNDQRMKSFVSDFMQDPLANDEHGNSSDMDCIIELDEQDIDAADTRDKHIISSGVDSFDIDTADDGDDAVVMVSAQDVVPDNSQRQQLHKRHNMTEMVDITDEEDDDDDGEDDEVDDGGGALVLSSKSRSDGKIEVEVLMPPLRASNVAPARTRPLSLKPPLLAKKPTLVQTKPSRIDTIPRSKCKVKVQQTDIIRPTVATPSTHVRNISSPQLVSPPQRKTQPQQQRPLVQQQRSNLQPQQQRPQSQLIRATIKPPSSPPPSAAKQSFTYITSAQPLHPTASQPVVAKDSRRIGSFPVCTSTSIIAQRTTAIIKSATIPFRPDIQQIKPVNPRPIQSAPSPSVAVPVSSVSSPTNGGSVRIARRRDVSANLAALRSELPSSLYSALAIHLQRKRGFFDNAETEFLTKLYTTTPKGYTTLRSLGWELPEEDVVKELLEMKDN